MRKYMLTAALVMLAGCGATGGGGPTVVPNTTAISTATAAPVTPTDAAPPGPLALLVVPGSNHVTYSGKPQGTYPQHCVAGTDPSGHAIPDSSCTPGSVRADVVQSDDPTKDTLAATICKPGWTATVRPPVAETDKVKTAAMTAYSVATPRAATELDHLVPLELGGSNDVSNLWPQPTDLTGQGVRNSKDGVENDLRAAVCNHRITLDDARRAIAADWGTAEHVVGLKP